MTACKAQDVARLVEAPPKGVYGFLIFGTDPGQVSERVRVLARRLSEACNPPGEIIRLHDEDLARAPDRLPTEVQTLPMFGGPKVVCVKTGPHLSNDQVEELFGGPSPAASLIIEAGNLKKDSKLRLFFERHKALVAAPCYGADAVDVARIIQTELQAFGLGIAPDALRQLQDSLGCDETLARAEVEKLALYATGEPTVTLAHVEAIVGDAAAMEMDDVIAAAFAGDAEGLCKQFDRVLASGTGAQSLLIALGSHLFRLHLVRAAVDAGEAAEIAVRKLRPPLFFKQEAAFKIQCRAWPANRLAGAIAMVQQAVRQARIQSELEVELAMRAFILIALEARKMRAGPRGR